MKRPAETEPPDSADLDAIRELKESLGWAHVWKRIEEEVERRRTELEQFADPQLTNHLRGYIKALRMVLDLPENLKIEFVQKPKGRA